MASTESDSVPLVEKVRTMMKIFDAGDLDGVMAMWAEDMRFSDAGLVNAIDLNRTEYRKWMSSFYECTKNLHIDVRTADIVKDKNVWIMQYRGTFDYVKDCPYFPVKATGKQVVLYGMSWQEVDEHFKTKVCNEYATYHWDGVDPEMKQ